MKSITKNSKGVVSVTDENGTTTYSNLTNVSVRHTTDVIYITHSDGKIDLKYSDISTIGGEQKPASIEETTSLLAGSFFIKANGTGGPVGEVNADAVTETANRKFITPAEKITYSGKQNALVSGTNIKTVNGVSLIGTGNIATATVQNNLNASTTVAPSASAVNIGLAAKQATLVSGTSIKTVNGTSLLGNGNIAIEVGTVGEVNVEDVTGLLIGGKIDPDLLEAEEFTGSSIDIKPSIAAINFTDNTARFISINSGNDAGQYFYNGLKLFKLSTTEIVTSTLNNNLIAYYPLNEISGNAIDMVGGHDGIPIDVIQGVDGKVDKCCSFVHAFSTGSGYIDAGNITDSPIFTIAAWVKTSSSYAQGIFGTGSVDGGPDILMEASGVVSFIKTGGDWLGQSVGVINTNEWVHLIVSRNEAGKSDFSINGVASGSATVATTFSTGLSWFIGGNGKGANFVGLIDEVKLWDRALTPTEKLELYNSY